MTTTTVRFNIGDTVELRPEYAGKRAGTVYSVTRVNPRTLTVVDENGGTLRGDAFAFRHCTDKPFTPRPVDAQLVIGAVVTCPRLPGGLYVVIKTDGDKANVAALGGNGNRYYRSVHLTALTVVPLDSILKEG